MISENAELSDSYAAIEALFESKIYKAEPDDAVWRSVQQAIRLQAVDVKPQKRRFGFIWKAAVAATIILAIGFGVFYFKKPSESTAKQNIVLTKAGSKTSLVLPDGSEVWLNADSKITYGDNFGIDKREVFLEGEAYFDVVKDTERPFIINTPVLKLKVLGTTFNVKAYPGEKNSEATLITGSLQVTLHNNSRNVIVLKPNEKLVVQNEYMAAKTDAKRVDNDAPLITISEVKKSPADSMAIEAQWIRNRLAFSDKKLEEVALQISRWFGVEVEIRSEELKDKEFSGLYRDQNLQQVMESLKLAGGFKYRIENNTVIIEQ